MKRDYLLILSLIAITGMTIASGAIHGRMKSSYDAAEAADIASLLEGIPDQMGDWQLISSNELGDYVVDVLECAGYVLRTYEDEERGQAVTMSVICGPPGPTSVHTAEICYDSRGKTIQQERRRVHLETTTGLDEEFWTLTFKSNDIDANLTRVYYAWSAGDRWQAPKQPRISLAKYNYLYKIQLAAVVPAGTDLVAHDPCRDFLRDFVPALSKYLRSQH